MVNSEDKLKLDSWLSFVNFYVAFSNQTFIDASFFGSPRNEERVLVKKTGRL